MAMMRGHSIARTPENESNRIVQANVRSYGFNCANARVEYARD
jgi:hypothetical protein